MAKALGTDIPHDSAYSHVTGESVYIDDRLPTRGELHVDFVGSPVAHGIIKEINLEELKSLPGIVGVYTYIDLLGKNSWGSIEQDQPFLAEKTCHYIGEPIVVIAAESREALRSAKRKTNITMEEKKPLLSIDDALKNESLIGKKITIKKGNVETTFASAKNVLEGEFENKGQEHFYLESHASLVYPMENGDLEVHSSAQHPTEVQHLVAQALGLNYHQVVCLVKRMGGGFGGKESQSGHFAALAGLVAQKTGKPVRLILERDDDMAVTGKRHGFKNNYKVAFSDEGLIEAIEVNFHADGGAYADLSTAILERALFHVDNAYYFPNALITGTVCRTNLPPNTAFRGFGGPQGVALIESIIEDIATTLNKDAFNIRTLNCYAESERNTTPYGQTVENNMLPAIFTKLAETSAYENRKKSVKEFNETSETHVRGLSLTAVKFGISFTTKFLNQANAQVNIHVDGTVQVSTGATEMGQGVNTQISQIVADCFSIDASHVKVMTTSTEKNHNTSATAASAGTDLNGSAALLASEKIKKRLACCALDHFTEAKAEWSPSTDRNTDIIEFKDGWVINKEKPKEKIAFKDLLKKAYLNRVSLGEYGFYKTPKIDIDKTIYQGRPFLYYTQGASMSEVEIDRFTGESKVLATHILMDLGKMINPGISYGQTCGGFVQGMGWVTDEDLVFDDKGVVLSHSPTTYKIPNIQDIPRDFQINFIKNPTFNLNVRHSKAAGEPPLMTALSVWAAIKNALSSMNPGKIIPLKLPATAEEILNNL